MAALFDRGSWSLKTQLALSSGLLMFAFSLASTSWVLHNVESDVRARVIDTQAALVRSTAADLEEKIALRRDALLTIAPLLAAAAPAPGPAMTAFFAPRPVLRKLFDDVLVVDTAGRIVHVGAAEERHDEDRVAERDYFGRILAGESFVISGAIRSNVTGDPFIAFAAPLRGSDGSITGALVGVLNLTRANFIGALGKRSLGAAGYFSLIDVSSKPVPVLLVHRDGERVMHLFTGGAHAPLVDAAMRGEETNETGPNFEGVECLRSSIRVKGVPWVLFAIYPTSQAFEGLRARTQEVLSVGAVLFIAAWLLAWMISNWLLRPIAKLQDVMERHANDPMLPVTAIGSGSRELTALVDAYNAQAATRHAFQSRLEASERHMKDITNNLPVLIAYVDRNHRCVFANATLQRWFGVDPSSVIGVHLGEVLGMQAYRSIAGAMDQCIAGERVSFEMRVETLQGSLILDNVYLPDRNPDGDIVGCYVLCSDVTREKAVQDQLHQLVRTDALTGLANRYHFDQALPLALARSAAASASYAVLFLDIDHFKHINDTLGHAAGDETLKGVARRLRNCLRTTDLVARLGGDEFVAILESPRSEDAVRCIAEKIVSSIARPFRVDGQLIEVTTSIGIAFGASGQGLPQDVLAVADEALYRAKTLGRARYCLERVPSMNARATAEIAD